jgi:hypothetical protein
MRRLLIVIGSQMIDSDEIKQIPAEKLHDTEMLTSIGREVLLLDDEDDRNDVCYSLAPRLIEAGNLDGAEFFVRLMESWPIERTWFLGDIATKLWGNGESEKALRLLHEAISIARTNGREWQRADALSKIASHFVEFGQRAQGISLLQEAIPIAQLGQAQGSGHDIEDSASVIRELAEKLAHCGEHEQAKQVASSITHAVKRERAVRLIQAIVDRNQSAG